MEKNLAELPEEILIRVAKRLAFDDFIAFGRVCTLFRDITVKENGNGKVAVPWLMLSRETQAQWCKFISLAVGMNTYQFVLPEVAGKLCLSSLGWIMTVGRSWRMSILNPFTRDAIKLPGLRISTDNKDLMCCYPLTRFVLSNDPCRTGDYMIAILYGNRDEVAFWRPGDLSWTKVKEYVGSNLDLIYYREQLMSISSTAKIMVYDIHDPNNPTRAQAISDIPTEIIIGAVRLYLVESAGSLLIVSQYGYPINRVPMTHFKVFEVDLESEEWKLVESLKNKSLFLGFNSSFSIAVDDISSEVKPNCIYFRDDCLGCNGSRDIRGNDIRIYSMADGSLQTLICGKMYNPYASPLWIQPRV